MLGIPHQTVLRSQSKYAIAIITLDFAEGTDPYWARQQVNERFDWSHVSFAWQCLWQGLRL